MKNKQFIVKKVVRGLVMTALIVTFILSINGCATIRFLQHADEFVNAVYSPIGFFGSAGSESKSNSESGSGSESNDHQKRNKK